MEIEWGVRGLQWPAPYVKKNLGHWGSWRS